MLKNVVYGNFKVFYKDIGETHLPVLVCLHGWGGGLSSFASLEPNLSKKYRLILPALPCFQKTDLCEPNFAYTLTDYANIVCEILKTENVLCYAILAHSFGARVAVQPELNAMPPKLNASSQKLGATCYIITGGAGLPPKFSLKTFLKLKLHKYFRAQRGSPDWRNLTQMGKQTFQNIREDLTENFKNLVAPTLLIWGEDDRDTPLYMGAAIKNLAQNAQLIVYERQGHFCFLTEPMRFSSDVLQFLKVWHRV